MTCGSGVVRDLQQRPEHRSSWPFMGRGILGLALHCPHNQILPAFLWEQCPAPCREGRQVCWCWLGEAALLLASCPQLPMVALPEDGAQDSLAGSGKGAETASPSVWPTQRAEPGCG